MSRMDDALARLEAALVRAEQAAAKPKPAATELEIEAELSKAREDYATLKNKSEAVAARLDDAIVRLDGMLGDAAE
jgi:FKBP-type peptidyl-prolyl cis-trans isomerase (trigger factor)